MQQEVSEKNDWPGHLRLQALHMIRRLGSGRFKHGETVYRAVNPIMDDDATPTTVNVSKNDIYEVHGDWRGWIHNGELNTEYMKVVPNAYIGKVEVADTPWVFWLGTQPLLDWPTQNIIKLSQEHSYRLCFTYRDMSHILEAFQKLLRKNMKSVSVWELENDSVLNNKDPIYLPQASFFKSNHDRTDLGKLRFSPFFVAQRNDGYAKDWGNYQFTTNIFEGFKAPFSNEGNGFRSVDLHITLPQRLPRDVLGQNYPELVERFKILDRRYKGLPAAHKLVGNPKINKAERRDLTTDWRNLKYYQYPEKDDVFLPTVGHNIPNKEKYRYEWVRDTSSKYEKVTGVLKTIDNLVLAEMPSRIEYDPLIKMWYNPATEQWSESKPIFGPLPTAPAGEKD